MDLLCPRLGDGDPWYLVRFQAELLDVGAVDEEQLGCEIGG